MYTRTPAIYALLLAASILWTGCSTNVLELNVSSLPSGATISSFNGKVYGVAPLKIRYVLADSARTASSATTEALVATWPDGEQITTKNIDSTLGKPDYVGLDNAYWWNREYVFQKSRPRTPDVLSPQVQQQQQQQTVIVPSGGLQPSGNVSITSDVETADIYVDGAFVSNTPATLKLADGIHIIEIKKPGHTPFRREVRVISNSDTNIRATLK